jgi:Polyketide cyclase / dehydrase and lipid transport
MTENDQKLAKQQYCVVVELDAPIDECFTAGYAEEAMMSWAPGAKRIVYDHSKAFAPYGPGSERTVTLNSGMSLIERVTDSNRPTFIGYSIPSFGGVGDRLIKNYQGHMTFEALGPNKTRLTWIGHFDCPGLAKITESLMRVVMKSLISKMANNLKSYVASKRS